MILLQYGCRNKIWAMKPLLDMLMWKGKDLTEPHSFDKEYKKLMICEEEELASPEKKPLTGYLVSICQL